MSRDTSYDSAIAVQEKVLDAIKVGQEATLTAVREVADAYSSSLPKLPEWAEAFSAAMPKLPEWAGAYKPEMPAFPSLPSLATLIEFTEKVWEGQRDFNLKLYDAIAPIGRSAFEAAKDTAKKVDKAATDSAKVATSNAKAAADNTKAAAEHTKAAAEHTTRSTTAKS
jgi:enoyl-CoA hydratase/carnithine racemase